VPEENATRLASGHGHGRTVDNGRMRWTVLDTPIGELGVGGDDVGICGVRFGPVENAAVATGSGAPPDVEFGAGLVAAVAELRAYFAGELTAFTVPLHVRRGSEFERAVWAEMSKIPYGETRTYGEVAAVVGDPGAARAVGVACNRNPIPVIVPCHRIVGAGGKLVGFGGGLPRKRHLLELEAGVAFQRAWT
jgi:methylated-DNA-[protein]-cysteine S-methyltransferase